jgi:cytochrome c553
MRGRLRRVYRARMTSFNKSAGRAAFLALFTTLTLAPLAMAAATARQELDQAMRATPNEERGSELYQQCISCHGPRAGGQTNGNTPRLDGQHFSVLVRQIIDFRHGKRWDFRMEEIADQHHLAGAQDIADVAFFISKFDSNAIPGTGDGNFTDKGLGIYTARCVSCHGANGVGNAEQAVPRLAGQHYDYLLRQMHDAVDGRRPTLSREHVKLLAKLDYEELQATADYLSRAALPSTLK